MTTPLVANVTVPTTPTFQGGNPVSVPSSLLKSGQMSPYNGACECFVMQRFASSIQAIVLDYVVRTSSEVGIFV